MDVNQNYSQIITRCVATWWMWCGIYLPSSRLTRTSWPARVLLRVRHTIVPMIHVMPCPVSASRATMDLQPPQEDDVEAHTPIRLDRQMSMARREFIAIPLKEGLSCMQSSSGILVDSLLSLLPPSVGSSLFWIAWCLVWGARLGPQRFSGGPEPPRRGWWLRDMNSGLLRTLFLSRALDLTLFAEGMFGQNRVFLLRAQ